MTSGNEFNRLKLMKVGFIGLGKMGSRMAGKLVSEGHEVVVWNRSSDVSQEFVSEYPNAEAADSIESLIKSLPSPRIVWIMVPSAAVEEILVEVSKCIFPAVDG